MKPYEGQRYEGMPNAGWPSAVQRSAAALSDICAADPSRVLLPSMPYV